MRWLLDTNAWIDYLKNASSPVAQHLRKHSPDEIVTCSVVKAELLHGALKYGVPQRRLAIVRATLEPYASLPFDDSAAALYGQIRHDVEKKGQSIGSHDLLIASICLSQGCTLVTGNMGEFSRITGLVIENWVTQ